MKVNWVSPLPPAQTDIANFTIRILPDLVRSADVCVWAEEGRTEGTSRCSVLRLDSTPETWNKLQSAKITFYNIGNNREFHSRAWEASRSVPGVMILHDIGLQEFFAGYYLERIRQPQMWHLQMRRYYGVEGYHAVSSYLKGECGMEAIAARFPLTELATDDALGVLVHTPEAQERLAALLPCPVAYAALPYPATNGSELERWARLSNRAHTPPWQLVVFGFLAANRRLRSVLEALGGLSEKRNFRLHICGTLSDATEINDYIRSRGLRDIVKYHGFVKDLDGILAGTDLAINLRYPTMGEASGSQLRIWDHSLPSLVTRLGWYASLPADCVRHVRPENEIEDIRASLQEFLQNPEKFKDMGRRGRRLLEEQHQPAAYVAKLMKLGDAALQYQPWHASLRLAERAADAMRPWSSGVLDTQLERASRAIRSLTGEHAEFRSRT